jgi:hypothetical protein
MVALFDYRSIAAGEWRLLVLGAKWHDALQPQILDLARAQILARHPQTVRLQAKIGGVEKELFVKVFHRGAWLTALKDQLRRSRAFNSWQQGLALDAAGFNAPLAVALGAEAGWRIARREFVVTEKICGVALPEYLRGVAHGAVALRSKRKNIKRLAQLIRRFHAAGFVHGDLLAGNIFIASGSENAGEFYFMDNDRTRRYPSWLSQSIWKRNLIQLNRQPLPGISLQDRMRFLHAYLDVKRLSAPDRRFARWLENRTRQRRKECDGADPTVSFRQLMRWTPLNDTARAR